LIRNDKGEPIHFANVITDITERKHAEEALRTKQHETEAMLAATRAIPEKRTFEEAARGIFDALKGLLGADSGYVALLSADGQENEVLFLDSGGRPCAVDPDLPMPIRGLRAEAYSKGTVVWENEFQASKWTKLMPDGHVGLDNVLFAPILVGGKAAGTIGLANKRGGYVERDAEMAKAFADIAAVGLRFARDQEALRKQREDLQVILDSVPAAIWYKDTKNRILRVNRVAAESMGMTPEQLEGRDIRELFPEDADHYYEDDLEVIRSGKPKWGIVAQMQVPGGDRRWVQTDKVPYRDEMGSIAGVIAFVVDITERKEAEELIEGKEKQMDNLLSNVDAIILEGDPFDVYYVGGQVERILGYPKELWFAEPGGPAAFWSRYLHPGDKDKADICRQAIANGQNHSFEYRMIASDGREVWFYDTITVETENGRPVKARSVMTDITERKQAEEAVKEENRLNELLLNSLPNPTMLISKDRTVLAANRIAQEVGARVGGYCWRDFGQSQFIPEQDKKYFDDHQQAPPGGTHCTFCLADEALTGQCPANNPQINAWERIWDTHWIPLDEEKYLHFAIDVTERRKTEEAVRNIAEGVSGATGEEFFRLLVQYLAGTLDADYAFVGELTEDKQETIRTIAMWAHGQMAEDFEYKLADTPCANVVGRKVCSYPHDVQKEFPNDHLLQEMGIESYVGSPLFDSEHRPLGIAVVLDSKPLSNPKLAESILQIFATRAAAELEREQAEGALRESEERHRALFEQAPDSVVVFDPKTGEITEFNDRTCENLGYTREEFKKLKIADIEVIESGDEVLRHLDKILRTGSDTFETKHRTKGGQIRDILVSAKAISIHGRDFVQGIWTDITERRQAEEALRESEMQNQALLEGSPVCNKIIDLDSKLRYMSAAGRKQLKIPDIKPYYGQTYPPEFYPESMRAPLIKHLKLAIKGEISSVEAPIHDMEGNEVWYHTTFVPACDDDGRVKYVIGSSVNVTERNRAEQALRESEERHRALFEQAPDSVVVFIPETGEITEFNDRTCENLGYTREEFKKLKIADIEVIESTDEVLRHLDKILRTGSDTFETKHRMKGGQIRDVLVNAKVISIHGTDFVQGIWTDITERKLSEEELKESEKRLRSLSEAAFEGIAFTEKGVLVDANEAFAGIFGYSLAELKGKKATELVAPEHRELVAENMRSGYEGTYEHKGLRKDGSLIDLEIHGRSVTYRGRRMRLTAIRDVTERRQAEEQARRHREQLLHVSRLSTVGEMASGLAHELNQPLSAILNYTEACLIAVRAGMTDVGKITENLQAAAQQTERAGEIIRRIRDFVKKRQPCVTRVEVNDLIREVVGFTSSDIRQNEVTLSLELQEELPPALADAIQVEQVLLNLVRNAIEAMSGTSRQTRRLTIQTSTSADDAVEVSVRDSGEGLPDDVAKQIFDPFFTTKPNGLGIGLSISRSIIEAHNGHLWAGSNPDGGSTLEFTLPIAAQESQ
jgi:PAS domain S-box-containing protein